MPSDIVVSTVATEIAQRLTFHVTNAMWSGLFDRIQVWRSRQGEAGPYEEVTGPAWSPAFFSILSRPYVVDEKTLSLKVQETTQIDITFDGDDPVAASDIATQIQDQSNGLLVSLVDSGQLIVQTAAPGAAASLRVLESDVAGAFGLSTSEPEAITFGHDARLILVLDQEVYNYVDPQGSPSFYYKIRFGNSLTNSVSDFSRPVRGTPLAALPASSTVIGTVDLYDLTGRANSNVRVLIYNGFNGSLVGDGGVVAGGPIEQRTDVNGHAEFSLVRGSKITVALSGTPLTRTLTVPTDPAVLTFNLLDPSLADTDVFTVQVAEVDYAERRSV